MPGINMFVIWLIVLIILAIFEMVTVALVSIWFCFGALSAMLLASFNFPVWVQLSSFVAVSALLIILTRPIMKNLLKQKNEKTNYDRIIGSIGIVTSEINNEAATGEIKIMGQVWTARSLDSDRIEKDKKVIVVKIEGVKAIVRPTEE